MPLFGRPRSQDQAPQVTTVTCPSCQEPVPADALVCPYCKGVLPPRPNAADAGPTDASNAATDNAKQPAPPDNGG